MKETNPEWRDLGIEPTDIGLRNRAGVSIAPGELAERLPGVVEDMIENGASWHDRLEAVRDEMVFYPGHGGERDGRYLLSLVLEAQAVREGDEAAELAAREERKALLADDVMLPRIGKGTE